MLSSSNMSDNFNMDFLDDYPSLENTNFALADSNNDNKDTNDNNNNKVQVRWLESEANLYLKYWRMGYRLLDDPYNEYSSKSWKKGQILDEYDRWYLTAKNILDIDLDFIRPKDYEKLNKIYNPSSSSTSTAAFSESPSSDIFFDDSIDNYELESNILQYSCFDFDENLDFMAAIKTNFIVKNGKIEFPNNNTSTKKRKPSEKPRKKPAKTAKTSPPQNVSTEVSCPVFVSTSSPSLSLASNSPDHVSLGESSVSKTPKKLSLANTSAGAIKRPKVLSNRRQMFVCEFPGCNYQSDRNFNFLRHKRTHGRIKGDTRKNNLTPRFMVDGEDFSTIAGTQISTLKPCETIIANPSTITLDERMHIEENDQSMTYESDDYIERTDMIMRDLNLNHVIGDNHKHTFAHIAIQQPFLS